MMNRHIGGNTFFCRMMVCSLFLAFIMLETPAGAMIAPDSYAYLYLSETVGNCPGVFVLPPQEIGNESIINIIVNNSQRRNALATIIKNSMINESIKIHFVDRNGVQAQPLEISGTLEEQLVLVQQLLEIGFAGNPLVNSISMGFYPLPLLFVMVKPELAQIVTHDLSERDGVSTYTIESLFEECLRPSITDVEVTASTLFLPH